VKPNHHPKTALITGASSGIGMELVRQLLRHKDLKDLKIIATARRLDRLEKLASEFQDGRVIPFAADLASPDDRERLWNFALHQFSQLDLIVNNAGFGTYCRFEEGDISQVQKIFKVDVEAVFDLTARSMAWMKPAGSGQIVQISSILGEVGLPYSATYTAAKHAVNGLVKSLRPELAGTGVSIWAACPGRTVSEFRETAGEGRTSVRGKHAEPTETVVAGIVRGILRGHSRPLLYPTWKPWLIAHVAWACPRLWDQIMIRYGRKFAAEDMPEVSIGQSK